MNAVVLRFDRQDILVLHCIFAEAGKPRLSVKPRPVGGELHSWYKGFCPDCGEEVYLLDWMYDQHSRFHLADSVEYK